MHGSMNISYVYFNLKMEAADSAKQFVTIYQNSPRKITGNRKFVTSKMRPNSNSSLNYVSIKYLVMGTFVSVPLTDCIGC
jgi:hypothetical protein